MDRLLSYFTFNTKNSSYGNKKTTQRQQLLIHRSLFWKKLKLNCFGKKKECWQKKIIILSGKHPSWSELIQTVHLVSLHFMSIFHYSYLFNCHICAAENLIQSFFLLDLQCSDKFQPVKAMPRYLMLQCM